MECCVKTAVTSTAKGIWIVTHAVFPCPLAAHMGPTKCLQICPWKRAAIITSRTRNASAMQVFVGTRSDDQVFYARPLAALLTTRVFKSLSPSTNGADGTNSTQWDVGHFRFTCGRQGGVEVVYCHAADVQTSEDLDMDVVAVIVRTKKYRETTEFAFNLQATKSLTRLSVVKQSIHCDVHPMAFAIPRLWLGRAESCRAIIPTPSWFTKRSPMGY